MRFRVVPWALSLVLCALVASGCAKARAATVPDGPPLSVPQPPERVLLPVEAPAPVAVAAPAEAPPPPAAAAPRTPPRPTPRAEEARPPVPAAAQTQPAPEGPRDLRAPAATNGVATERAVRDVLARATRDLGRVNYNRLSADGRAQHDQAKRFAQQAEQALKERNLVFAATLSDKAATLAAELLGR